IEACRLGQTERGSFVATLICPLNALPDEDLPEPSDATGPRAAPFARRVTSTFMKSLGQITELIDQDTPERILNPAGDDIVISANLCDALVEMQPSAGTSLQVSCKWGFTEIAPPPQVGSIRVATEAFPLIEEFARSLRPAEQPRRDRFVGRVDNLSGQPDADGHMSGRITLLFLYDDETLRAQIELTEEDYGTACDAHKDARYVSLMGVLHRGARNHTIRDYGDFAML
ncbi:MAG: hypothetical protein ACREAC_01395, partial [Blastocatellia bacterium]